MFGRYSVSLCYSNYSEHVYMYLTRIAPVRDVNRALDRGTLGSLNPTPWAVMTANTTAWVIYSYLIEVRSYHAIDQ